MEQWLLVSGFILSIDSWLRAKHCLSIKTVYMRLRAAMVVRPHFPPWLVFLFNLCSDGRSNYQSQEEAATVYSLWEACWELQTSGKGKKYTSSVHSFILQCPKADKAKKEKACTRTNASPDWTLSTVNMTHVEKLIQMHAHTAGYVDTHHKSGAVRPGSQTDKTNTGRGLSADKFSPATFFF